MNWKALKDALPGFFKQAALPALAIVVAVVLLLPSVRDWLTSQLQERPLWGAAVLAAICFIAIYLILPKRVSPGAQALRDAGLILSITLVLLGVGFIFTGASAVLATEDIRPAAWRCAILWAAACFMGGFLIGFLFGVPKVIENGPTPSQAGRGPAAPANPTGFAQRPNTNLEQISDWLTKIIVGLGLVELKSIPSHLIKAATWIAQSLSSSASPSQATVSFAGSLIVYFSIVGFLAGYLLTLLFLAGAFGRAGQQAYGGVGFFDDDAASKRIRDFYRPGGGPPNPENARKLAQWIKTHLPEGASVGALISTKELEQPRQKVIEDLNIP